MQIHFFVQNLCDLNTTLNPWVFCDFVGSLYMFLSANRQKRLLRATREAPNPNLQIVITHASHICCQHSFEFPLRMNGMHGKQFDHEHLAFYHSQSDHACFDYLSRKFYAKHTSTAMQQKRFDLRSLLPALRNLCLFLVVIKNRACQVI